MTRDDLFHLYERLYFHEIDMREKLNSRMQIPLAIIVAQITLLGYVLKGLTNIKNDFYGISTIIFLACAIFLIAASIYYFIRSWYNYEYSFLPAANKTEEYRSLLLKTYSGYEDCDLLVENALKDYLYNYYADCSTVNTNNNDRRSIYIHKTSKYLIATFVIIFLTITSVNLSNKKFRTSFSQIVEMATSLKQGDILSSESSITQH